ncbi:MAG: proton-conducting transporter membrane subunit [Pseudomonadales bacterium]|nr:proton-conducting transporter membrane subunit [Pseudomonadales bacterium]
MAQDSLAFVPFLTPLLYLLAGLIACRPGTGAAVARALVRGCAVAGLLAALGSIGLLASYGPLHSGLRGIGEAGVSVHLDGLSATMLLLVSFLGLLVTEYARNQLENDVRQALFLGQLCLTLAAVALLMISANLIELIFAWVATSLALHRLLRFRAERPGARAAARKKFLVARVGDAALFVAIVLLAGTFQTTDLQTLLDAVDTARIEGLVPLTVPLAAVLLALAAVLKSALFPFHGWLIDMMETPTPVSALLLAGIVNAGGFLLLRFADVLLAAPVVMGGVAVLGGCSALLGAAVMLTQTRVKSALAWSTVSQMGFLLLQCGLGVFAGAVLHLVAHALFKAHAFLATGDAAGQARVGWAGSERSGRSAALRLASLGLVLGALWLAAYRLPPLPPVLLTLGLVFAIGLWLPVAGAPSFPVFVGRLVLATALAPLWLLLQSLATRYYAPLFPDPRDLGVVGESGLVALVAGAVLLAALQLSGAHGGPLRRLRVHLAAGLYANVLLDRLVGAHRVKVSYRA